MRSLIRSILKSKGTLRKVYPLTLTQTQKENLVKKNKGYFNRDGDFVLFPRGERRFTVDFLRKGSIRNLPCFCGSGKKYKKCCLEKNIPTGELLKIEEGDPSVAAQPQQPPYTVTLNDTPKEV